MTDKLTPRQKAQLAVLETLPPKFQQIHRLVEEIAGMRVDETVLRRLTRLLDESKAATNTVGLTALTETMGIMGMLARRSGGHQMKVRGLREGMNSLKINFEGALRSASMAGPEGPEGPEAPTTG
jgi:hypothetical protein